MLYMRNIELSIKEIEKYASEYSEILHNSKPKKIQKVENIFSGPSIYFHRKAIFRSRRRKDFLSDRHLEYIYAALASWGMHRLGPSETKLADYELFKKSIRQSRDVLKALKVRFKNKTPKVNEEFIKEYMARIRKAFNAMVVSTSNSHLVANSKVLHHIIPSIFTPIDRRYTLTFFHKSVPPAKKKQFQVFWNLTLIMLKMIQDAKVKKILQKKKNKRFNTSILKKLDNAIIERVKIKKKKKKKK